MEVRTLLLRLAWVSSAPFGLPVVPEVYRMTAVSSAVRATISGSGVASASSRSNSSGSVTITSTPVCSAALPASAANIGCTTATCTPASRQA